jgi:hypothetical protein
MPGGETAMHTSALTGRDLVLLRVVADGRCGFTSPVRTPDGRAQRPNMAADPSGAEDVPAPSRVRDRRVCARGQHLSTQDLAGGSLLTASIFLAACLLVAGLIALTLGRRDDHPVEHLDATTPSVAERAPH